MISSWMEVFLVMSELMTEGSVRLDNFNAWSALIKVVSASATLTGLGTILTFFVVFAYLHTIGTPELIGKALAAPSELWPLIIVSSIMLLFYLVMLLITTAAYASAVNLFRRTPDVQRLMAYYLLIPTLAGVVATVCSTLLKHSSSIAGLFVDSSIWVGVGMLALFFTPRFYALLEDAISGQGAEPPSRLQFLVHMLGIAVGVWVAAMSATFPMIGVLKATPWPSSSGGMNKFVFFSILVTFLGFIPAIAYYVSKGDRLIKMRNAAIGLMVMTVGTLAVIPSMLPTIVDQAAKLAGVKDTQVFSYMLKETYAAEDFDEAWGRVITTRTYPVVEGFILFSLGEVTLLCPKSIDGSSLSEWASVTGACVTMNSKMVVRMPTKGTFASAG
ncbi:MULTISPECIES: hypothetical protein [unclassified Pseudomonas]|uniref:hypothetical protein n=1 Tax=unclassified Pseudomonas TaxID=196821 RepID=UPI00224ADAA5|nr:MULTISPECIES: hypothetical protein [unclassified Pseudomonas]MCX2812489.1 hypothetical protein [Pseudomonas sp. DCB_E]MCX9140518.1 hypothetical protein [Pseudomonas sp. DCB_Q]